MALADDLATLAAQTRGEIDSKVVQAILARWFPPKRGGYSAYVNSGVDIGKLDKDHRQVLVALSSGAFDASFGHSGLPPDARSRRRLLGLAPKTVLEDVISAMSSLGFP